MADLFHPELRLARFVPPIGLAHATYKLMRSVPRPVESTPTVTATTVFVAGGDGDRRYRAFRPARRPGPLPLVFWLHGGGMVVGSPEQDDAANQWLAERTGAVVVAASYRLAPEHPVPAALDDVTVGLYDVLGRAGEFGIDPDRFVIAGASAGGGLAAALVNRLHDEGGPRPLLQLLVYPMLDDRTVLRDDVDTRGLRGWLPSDNRFGWESYLGRTPGGADVPAAFVPARRDDLAGLPPAWIGVGTLDLFHDEAVAYARRLTAAGVACELYVVPGAFHGFDTVPLFQQAAVTRAFRGAWVEAIRDAFAA